VLKGHLKLSVLAAVIKVLVFPAIGLCFLWFFDVGRISLRIGMIFFALPIAPSAYLLAAQLRSDTDLASASIAGSTVLALLSLPVVMLIF
jgi:predicted permease